MNKHMHRRCVTQGEDALPCAVKLACRDSPVNPTVSSHGSASGIRKPASSSLTTSESSPHPFSTCPFSLLLSHLRMREEVGMMVMEIRTSGKPHLVLESNFQNCLSSNVHLFPHQSWIPVYRLIDWGVWTDVLSFQSLTRVCREPVVIPTGVGRESCMETWHGPSGTQMLLAVCLTCVDFHGKGGSVYLKRKLSQCT